MRIWSILLVIFVHGFARAGVVAQDFLRVDMCDDATTVCPGDPRNPETIKELANLAVRECSPLEPTPKCAQGYFGIGNQWDECCDGFYCPPSIPCRIPCSDGAYCARNRSVPDPDTPVKCMLYGDLVAAQTKSDGTIAFHCGGAHSDFPCPAGFYCPIQSAMEICPAGYYCREGEVAPQPCPFLSVCPDGTSAPTLSLGGLVVVMGFFLILLVYLTQARRFSHACAQIKAKLSKRNGLLNHTRRTTVIHERESTLNVIRHDLDCFIEELASEEFKLGEILTSRMTNEALAGQEIRSRQVTKSRGMTLSKYDAKHASVFRKKKFTVDIEFRDLGLNLKASKRRILHSVTGQFRAGEVSAIMGPSGAGKTSFLFTLCGKAEAYGIITGEIKINGEERRIREFSDISGFVPQHDIMHPTLTVREILTFNAQTRLPHDTTPAEIEEIVTKVIGLLGLAHVEDVIVGDERIRGISGGQKKRVNIGMELVADPAVLFLDEPTSGLDSATSRDVVNVLKEIAKRGVNVIVVLHQPRFEIFDAFDSLLLLGTGGRTVYMGPREDVVPYFQEMGFELPKAVNPADFVMDATAGVLFNTRDPGFTPEHLILRWEERESIVTGQAVVSVAPSSRNLNYRKRVQPGFGRQMLWFLSRNFLQMRRSIKTQISSWVLFAFAGLVVGILFSNPAPIDVGLSAYMTMIALSIPCVTGSLRLFGPELLEMKRESWSGMNMNAYFCGKLVFAIVDMLLAPFLFLCVYYGFAAPRGPVLTYYLILMLVYFTCQGLALIVSLTMQPGRSELFGMIITLVLNMLSGVRPSLTDLRKVGVIGRFGYSISFGRYACEAIMLIELQKWPPVYQGFRDQFVIDQGIDLGNLGYDIGGLLVMAVVFRIFAFWAFRRKSQRI